MTSAEPPLLGRRATLDDIVVARRSGKAAVVVAGPLGSGRSRLLREALDELAAPDRQELVVVPNGAADLGLFALRHLAGDAATTAGPTDLAHLIDSRLRARGPGLVLGIDDAHHLDTASAALLHQLVTTGGAFAVFTVRAGAAVPAAVTALWKDGAGVRVDLGPLAEVEVEGLMVAMLGGPVEATTMRHISESSGGNPLVVRELVLAGTSSGALRDHDGTWRWRGPEPASTRLQELLAARLDPLRPDERWAVEVVALGGPIPLDRFLTSVSPETLDTLESSDLLAVAEGTVSLRQPAHASVIASLLPTLRARAVRRDAARLLDDHDAPWRLQLRAALLRHAAGDDVDPVSLASAAYTTMWSSGLIIADALADGLRTTDAPTAARRVPTVPLGGEADTAVELAERAWALERCFATGVELAQVLGLTGDGARAAAVLADLADLAEGPDQRALVAMATSTLTFWTEGCADEADALLRAAEDDPQRDQRDPAFTRELRRIRAGNQLNRGRPAVAVELGTPLMRERIDDMAGVRTPATVAAALGMNGRVDEALTLIDDSLEFALAHTASNPEAAAQLMMAKFGALARGGRIVEAAELATACLRAAIDAGSVDGVNAYGTLAGKALMLQGRLADATVVLREALPTGPDRTPRRWTAWTLAMLAGAHARRGEVTAATDALDACRTGRTGDRFYDVDVFLAAADVHEADGRLGHARSHAVEAAQWAAEAAMPVDEAIAWHTVARLGGAADAAARLDRLRGAADGRFIDVLADHVMGVAGRDVDLLDAAVRSAIELGLGLVAAEAANDRAALVPRTGRSRADSAALRRADELADACQGARFSRLDGVPNAPALTRRELEVARLASTGLTSRDIADRLGCSVRTVETHLYRVFFKLGVTDRAALADIPGIGPHP